MSRIIKSSLLAVCFGLAGLSTGCERMNDAHTSSRNCHVDSSYRITCDDPGPGPVLR